jgi:hypothetical protein
MTEKNILDMNDLVKYYKKLRKKLREYNYDNYDYDKIFGYGRTNLVMRFHQQVICNGVLIQINNGETQILLGCKPRSG